MREVGWAGGPLGSEPVGQAERGPVRGGQQVARAGSGQAGLYPGWRSY